MANLVCFSSWFKLLTFWLFVFGVLENISLMFTLFVFVAFSKLLLRSLSIWSPIDLISFFLSSIPCRKLAAVFSLCYRMLTFSSIASIIIPYFALHCVLTLRKNHFLAPRPLTISQNEDLTELSVLWGSQELGPTLMPQMTQNPHFIHTPKLPRSLKGLAEVTLLPTSLS